MTWRILRAGAGRAVPGVEDPSRGGADFCRVMVRRRRRKRQRGVALIMVLSSITVLTVMLAEFQDETSAELGSALSERDALVAEYAAVSGINLSRLLIAAEPTIRKSVALLLMGAKQLAVWEFAPDIMGAFNGAEGKTRFEAITNLKVEEGKNLGFEGASFELEVVDEDAKLNVNSPARGSIFYSERLASQFMGLVLSPQYDPLFEQRGADGNYNDRAAICSAVIDWVDPDQQSWVCGVEGSESQQQASAEDSFYELLKKPYFRKNAAFDSLEELHLVRGFGEEFWATFVEPDPDEPRKRLLTVWGGEQVNVNTAEPLSLWALICSRHGQPTHAVCTDLEQARALFSIFSMIQSFARGMPLFGSPQAFLDTLKGKGMFGPMLEQQFGLPPMEFLAEGDLKKWMTTESKVFSVYSTGVVKNGQRETRVRVHAVVDFRQAPPPGQARQLDEVAESLGMDASSWGANSSSAQANPAGDEEEAALNSLLQPSPGGEIIYYRIN